MIKVIAFDFGGVLGPDVDDWNHTFKEINRLTDLTSNHLQSIFEKYWPRLKLGKETMKQFWTKVSKISKRSVKPEILRRKYNEAIWINNELLEIIKQLKEKYKVIMIANDSDDDYFVKTSRLKLNKFFDKLYCSSQLKISKPNRKIFKYVLKDQNIRSHKMLFVDNQKNNIKAAELLGIRTILYENNFQLKTDIAKLFI